MLDYYTHLYYFRYLKYFLSLFSVHPSAQCVGLRCPLPDGRPWTTCGRGGGHLQGQTDRSHIQPPGYCTGGLMILIITLQAVVKCVLKCWIVCAHLFFRLWSMSCFMRLASLKISSTPGETVRPLLQVFKTNFDIFMYVCTISNLNTLCGITLLYNPVWLLHLLCSV